MSKYGEFLIPLAVLAVTISQFMITKKKQQPAVNPTNDIKIIPKNVTVMIMYGSCTGTAKTFAFKLSDYLLKQYGIVSIVKDSVDFDDADIEKANYFFLLSSTWTDGKPPLKVERLYEWLLDYATDFRVSKDHLSKVSYAVFGLGAKVYGKNFCKTALEMDGHLKTLGANCLRTPVLGDDASDLELQFEKWQIEISMILSSHLAANDDSYEESVMSKTSPNPIPFILTEQDMDGLSRKERKELKKATRELKALHYQEQNAKMSQADSTATGVTNNTQSNTKGGCSQSNDITSDHKHSGGCCQTNAVDSHAHTKGEATASGGCCSAPNADDDNDDDDGTVELEEEDLINDQFVTYDQIDSDEESEEEEDDNYDEDDDNDYTTGNDAVANGNIGGCGEGDEHQIDLEDLGKALSNSKTSASSITKKHHSKNVTVTDINTTVPANENLKEMATKLQRKALTKEGYKLIGSHSAVKLCRWTKHQLRGRGGCYKHTFYGINSYQCMEATPSLACANKCVFCWRHHRNPVGTEWRWKMDDPAFIVEQGVNLHRSMINEFKGASGVIPERLKEAFNVRHCALSLVGEPIMYPRINEMLKELHIRKISSFLVTNAQFPERIQQLDPVTQLYVSVDASSRDALKAIDRPLFKDFWERFLACLKELRHKQQRTVYRMTLVKDWNMNAVDEYVELIEMGQPDFIEIKGVTFCGKSDASTLTMENVPWHDEVCRYSELIGNRLNERNLGPRYSIATEHEHSCCILLAREDKFKINGHWHTWIDYDKFNLLIQEFYDSNGKKTFSSSDYIAPTPEWALYQSETHGFDPIERRRWKKIKAGATPEMSYKPSDSGCG